MLSALVPLLGMLQLTEVTWCINLCCVMVLAYDLREHTLLLLCVCVCVVQVCTDFYIAVQDHALPQLADIAAALQANEALPAAPATHSRSSPQALGQAQPLQQVTHLRSLPGPSSKKLTWRFLDQLVRESKGRMSGYKLDTIKEAVKLIRCKVTGSKAELVVRLMQALGLQQPAAAPAKLLVALQEQRLRRGQV